MNEHTIRILPEKRTKYNNFSPFKIGWNIFVSCFMCTSIYLYMYVLHIYKHTIFCWCWLARVIHVYVRYYANLSSNVDFFATAAFDWLVYSIFFCLLYINVLCLTVYNQNWKTHSLNVLLPIWCTVYTIHNAICLEGCFQFSSLHFCFSLTSLYLQYASCFHLFLLLLLLFLYNSYVSKTERYRQTHIKIEEKIIYCFPLYTLLLKAYSFFFSITFSYRRTNKRNIHIFPFKIMSERNLQWQVKRKIKKIHTEKKSVNIFVHSQQ